MSLADLQRQLRDALVGGEAAAVGTMLVGGRNPLERLAIHQRHYEASLTAAVVGRFPATEWLIGSRRLEEAARQFVHEHPPTAPCIAEYATQFPAFLATWPETAQLTYLPEFADLDWHLGRLAVSSELPAVGRQHLAAIDAAALADASVSLQPGTHYVHTGWPIDELIAMYVAGTPPESWTLVNEEVHIEARGSRGSFGFSRLRPGDYAFRVSLSDGHSLGDAVDRALEIDPSFDPGLALLTLVDARLITSVNGSPAGGAS